MFQLIDMTPGEIQWLSNHMGHDVATHYCNYRLHAPAIEITKVGKMLLAIDQNNAGKSLRKMCQTGKYVLMLTYCFLCALIVAIQIHFLKLNLSI